MSFQPNFLGLLNATSSPASGSGVTPSEKPDGQIVAPSGPDTALANLSARQAEAKDLLTSGTFGPIGFTSSASADLALSLVNKLHQMKDSLGSTLYKLIWKERATPSGRSIYALRASVRLVSVNDRSGWVMPSARDRKDRPGMATTGTNPDGSERTRLDQLPRQAQLMDFGRMPNGCPTRMEQGGHLNPAHSRWLMGLPSAWDDCAVMETPSMPKWQPPLSGQPMPP